MASGTMRRRRAGSHTPTNLARLALLVTCASCAGVGGAPPAPAPGTATVWGEARLVPRSDVEPFRKGAYADERYRDAEPVDYDHIDFAVVTVDAEGAERESEPIEIRIENSRFGLRLFPELAATSAGSDVVVRNATDSPRTFSSPQARLLRRLEPGESATLTLDEPGTIDIRVLEDREAAATVFVVGGPFCRVSADGRYEIAGLRPGRHRLRAWHARFPGESIEIHLAADEVRRVDLRIGVGQMDTAEKDTR